MDEEVTLQELGLTKIEAEVYIALLKLGSTKTGPIVKKTELHRATVYDVLNRLMEKGLVNYITKQKTKYFEATRPEHIMDAIAEEKEQLSIKEERAKYLIYRLNKIKEQSKQRQNAHIFVGKRGVKTIFEEVYNHKENLVFGSSGRFKEVMGSFFYQFQKRKKELRITTKLIVSERVRGTDVETSVPGQRRFIPEEYESPVSTIIYGDRVATFVWLENPIAFLIESKEAAMSYGNYFEMLWKIGKK